VLIAEHRIREPAPILRVESREAQGEEFMGRYMLLWLLGVPIPILLLIWLFGGLH
jgi:hypothetical protein